MPMPSQRALPANKNPVGTRCITIEIPDDDEWENQAFSELTRLAIWNFWKFDVDHSGTIVARKWRKALDTWKHCKPVKFPVIGAGGDDENLIRQNPDNPCELQTSIDGTNWCTFADFSLCIPAPAQPARDTEQPAAGGGQACYQGELLASSKWLLPTPVSTGDTLELTRYTGAGSDGGVTWRCGDGNLFFAGDCQPNTQGFDAGDPDAAEWHMELIWVINGSVYLPADQGVQSVPSGVVNGTVVLQVNDGSLGDNWGSYQFEACVTNNAAATWSHTFDFTLGNHGWSIISGSNGTYVPGVGFQSTTTPGHFVEVDIEKALASRTITRFKAFYHWAQTVAGNGTNELLETISGTPTNVVSRAADTASGDYTLETTTSHSVVTKLSAELNEGDTNAGCAGTITISKIVVEGVGTDPF